LCFRGHGSTPRVGLSAMLPTAKFYARSCWMRCVEAHRKIVGLVDKFAVNVAA
jgi:hypothetical protein